MPVNFAFLVPQAMMKGLTKLTFCESSVCMNEYEHASTVDTR